VRTLAEYTSGLVADTTNDAVLGSGN